MGDAGLRGVVMAIVGGDEREQEIARLAVAAGASVRAYGFPWPDGGIDGVARCGSADAALEGARYAIFPVPGMGADGSLFAPAADEPIVPNAALLARLAPGAAIILGTADDALRDCAASRGVSVVEYESDAELMLLRGPAVVEGVISLAIANTVITLHGAVIAVVGHGKIGRLLATKLVSLSAHVHVFARNPVQRAEAYTSGCAPHSIEALATWASQLDMLFSTASARVVGREVLTSLPAGALVMDLAAPPGSIDLDAASDLGLRAIWARGQGARAPVTVGRSQWMGVRKRIEELEEARN
jgi:dipicolinate synthase subunit A